MPIIIAENFDREAAELISGKTIALPTGNTPVGMYQELKKRNLDWGKITVFMLDVNYSQDPAEPDSFYSFAKKYLPTPKFNILDSLAKDPAKECADYEAKIAADGGLDLAVLGIGFNGHIAYNEPGTGFDSLTHLAELSPETIKINNLQVHHGLTMGIKTILNARKILVLVKGAAKAAMVKRAIDGPVDVNCPASVLQRHPDVTWLLDPAAGSLLK